MAPARSQVAMWAVPAAVLALFAFSLRQAAPVSLAVSLLIGLVCVAVIARASAATVGVGFIVMFSFTASWDQASLGGVKPRMIFLLLGLTLLFVGFGVRRRPAVPWWIHVYPMAAIAVTVMQFFFPISETYLNHRYLASAAGQALLTRPGTLPSLGSLLFNAYAVPLAIVLACLFNPKALRWIISAYVSGAALSCAAAYLGYQGNPVLLKLLVSPPPPGIRALGFTSHPLHLATSAVMAIALAVWMAVQPNVFTKWCGRISLVALLLGLYASGSRGGNGAAVVALALCTFLLPTLRRRIHTVAAVAAVLLGGVIAFAPSLGTSILRTTRLYGGLTTSVSDTGRSQVLDQGLNDWRHSPIYGIGVRYIAEAHILYVGMLASGGVILFAAYLAFNIGSLRAARRAVTVDRALGGAVLATLLSSLVYWAVADDFQVATVQILYGFLLAVLLRDRHDDRVSADEPEEHGVAGLMTNSESAAERGAGHLKGAQVRHPV